MVGATIHVLRGFDPGAAGLVEQEQITQLFGLPMMFRPCSTTRRSGAGTSPACAARVPMAPMPDQLIRRCLDGFGCDFALLFGQTEMSPVTTLFRPEHQLTHIGASARRSRRAGRDHGPDGELLPRASRARSSTAAEHDE